MGNFQALANKILIKAHRDVSCFASLGVETRNNALPTGNIEGNQAGSSPLNSMGNKACLVETAEETKEKLAIGSLETHGGGISPQSFLSASTLSTLLSQFFAHTLEQGIDLLHEDKSWLSTMCFGVPLKQLKLLLIDYLALWSDAMNKENINHKKQNAGRAKANNFIREKLASKSVI